MSEKDPAGKLGGGAMARWFGLQVAAKAVSVALGTPLVAAIVSAVLAYAQGLPLFWVFLGALVAAAATSTLLNQARSFLLAYNAANKIVLLGVEVARAKDDEGVEGYGMALKLENRADIPMEFRIDRVAGNVEGRLAVDRLGGKGGLVIAGASFNWGIGVVPMDAMVSAGLKGAVDVSLRYGRPGKLRHRIERTLEIRVSTDAEGFVTYVRAYHDD